MLETSVRLVHHQDADVVGPVGLEGSCHGIRQIAERLRCLLHPFSRCRVDIVTVIQCFTNSCSRNTARLSNVFN